MTVNILPALHNHSTAPPVVFYSVQGVPELCQFVLSVSRVASPVRVRHVQANWWR